MGHPVQYGYYGSDATVARVMDHEVESLDQLTMGFNMGLGEIREKSIETIESNLEDLKVRWKPAKLYTIANNL